MKTTTKQLKLGVFVLHAGYHLAGWRHPEAISGGENLALMIEIAKTAEAGKLDMLFFPDVPGSTADSTPSVISRFEPLTLLSTLSAHTKHIGLAATASTTYHEPMNVARMFASLDHLSQGRAAWNLVTTLAKEAAGNFGAHEHLKHADRYARATEFVQIVRGLWDSWEDDAFPRDKASGQYFDVSKLHTLNFRGETLSVRGPLNLNRPPQGHPVVVVAGASEDGRRLAASHADVSFTAQHDLATAQAYYRDIKEKTRLAGRHPEEVLVMPAVVPVIGATEREAKEKFDLLQSLTPIEQAIPLLSFFLGHDVSKLPLDEPLPNLGSSEAMKSRTDLLLELALKERWTVRQLALSVAASRGHLLVVGTPETVADTLEHWFKAGAADGFNIMPPYFPGGLRDFVDGVVPLLQARGLFRRDYTGTTLREHLGLQRPRHPQTMAHEVRDRSPSLTPTLA
ncbi:MAG: nitrilotriacetate monooxygenase [Curvibacter sp. PD_MW3]|nr:MAG: nitrilotriacetate monooxygenase [Curvibacter sp. PD_MW3]